MTFAEIIPGLLEGKTYTRPGWAGEARWFFQPEPERFLWGLLRVRDMTGTADYRLHFTDLQRDDWEEVIVDNT